LDKSGGGQDDVGVYGFETRNDFSDLRFLYKNEKTVKQKKIFAISAGKKTSQKKQRKKKVKAKITQVLFGCCGIVPASKT
jgi:hypothetical protein